MSNKDIQGLFQESYNKFFCKWRDNLPEIHDVDGWNVIYNEATALIEKYQCFDDGEFAPCYTIIQTLANILDDRKRITGGLN